MRSVDRSHLLVAVIIVVVAFVLVSMSPFVEHEPAEPVEQADVRIIAPVENGNTTMWPYTSRGRTFTRATLPINVVVHSDAATVNRLLQTRATAPSHYWNESADSWVTHDPEESNVTLNGTGIHWGPSAGSERYTYIRTEDEGVWKKSTYQIHDGTYFGSRNHLRLYEGGSNNQTWTAIQAHHEYWDWFRLRHDVNSLSRAQYHVEQDLMDSGLTADVRREYWANGGAIDSDGWVTAIDLSYRVTSGPQAPDDTEESPSRHALVVPLIWLALPVHRKELLAAVQDQLEWIHESRIDRSFVALFASTALIPLIVRIGAITAERTFPAASPIAVGGPFYLLLVLGLPASAYLFGRHVSATDGFIAAVFGAGMGMMLDYAYLGLVAIPYGALVQRIVLLIGLGLIAAGGTRWATTPFSRHRYHTVGAVIWVGILVWPLLG